MEPTPENLERLRLLIAERIPANGTDESTLLSDEELTPVLENHPTMFGAAAEGWAIKTALYAKFIDIDESGSARKLNQMFKNAEAMMKFYAVKAQVDADLLTAAVGRAVGRSARWGDHAGLKARMPAALGLDAPTSTRYGLTHRWMPSIQR